MQAECYSRAAGSLVEALALELLAHGPAPLGAPVGLRDVLHRHDQPAPVLVQARRIAQALGRAQLWRGIQQLACNTSSLETSAACHSPWCTMAAPQISCNAGTECEMWAVRHFTEMHAKGACTQIQEARLWQW